ncbi:phage tail length tape measure family protein [Methylorubrum extorquens]|uniref:phage tail length tape measure family protein n=1 Tax=Methylorubrum extorquens TaxID=408 RepID=UPI000A2F0918|nr:phage tail length tape measure family protein [Methylorubrum extorquens]
MTERRVVELVVDSRGAEQGFSRYATAATQAGAASDRAADAEDRLQAAMAKATTSRERVVESERRLEAAVARQAQGIVASTRLVAERASSFTRLAAAVDPVVRAEQAMERATRAADAAVRRGAATTDEAARVVGLYRQRHDEAAAAADRAAAATLRLTAAQRSQVQTRIEGAAGVKVDFGTAGRGADVAAYGAEMDRVRAKLVPLAAAQQTYRSQLAEIAQAAKVGAISESERVAALARTKEAFAGQVVAIRNASAANENGAKATGLHAQAWQSLGFQVNDAVTMIASGSSPLQVLATQGGQVYQALDGPKGVTGGLKEAGNFLLGLLTPARLLVGGLVGIGLAGVAAGLSWQGTQSEIRRALAGVGRAAGATAGDIEGIATATAAASDTSISAARTLALELAKTGKIGRDNLAPIAGLGKSFAATLGLDAAEGNQVLARSFAEPGKGAENLARNYGLLSDATVQYIRHLEDSNERGRAQQVLMEAPEH